MMQLAQMRSHLHLPMDDTSLLRKQLQREITCLEMQLDRLRRRDDFLDIITLQTYEEMIVSRRDILETL